VSTLIIVMAVAFFVSDSGQQSSAPSIVNEGDAAYAKAVEAGNPKLCSSIADQSKRLSCERKAANVAEYKQAVRDLDIEKCDKLSTADSRRACRNVVSSGLNFRGGK
jgi:uncharacterized protein YaaR (DUF327 family)